MDGVGRQKTSEEMYGCAVWRQRYQRPPHEGGADVSGQPVKIGEINAYDFQRRSRDYGVAKLYEEGALKAGDVVFITTNDPDAVSQRIIAQSLVVKGGQIATNAQSVSGDKPEYAAIATYDREKFLRGKKFPHELQDMVEGVLRFNGSDIRHALQINLLTRAKGSVQGVDGEIAFATNQGDKTVNWQEIHHKVQTNNVSAFRIWTAKHVYDVWCQDKGLHHFVCLPRSPVEEA